MNDTNNLKENIENINNKIEYEMELKKLKEVLFEKFEEYQKTIKYLSADAPIEILCLPKQVETILLNNGCLRVYDVLNMDFTKIEGIGPSRLRNLTSRLDQFFSMF